MKKLFLFDANSLIHRAFHALPPFTAPDGRPTGALYGISSILIRITKDDAPEYAAALFDRPEPTFREEEYKEYKAQRPPTADGLVAQLIEAQNLFPKFGISVFEAPRYEADDGIATLVARFKHEKDLVITIFTGDMDTLQLVEGEKIVVRSLKKGVSDTAIYDERRVHERYGLSPLQVVDYKALVGDPSDNIKGVQGIGPKTALALLLKHGSIEEVFRHPEDLPARVRARKEDAEKEAVQAKWLVTLCHDAPLKASRLEDLSVRVDYPALTKYFESLGFDSLVQRLSPVVPLKQSLF